VYHAPCCPSTPMFGWRPSGGHWILSRIIREGECCTLPAASTSDGRRYPKRAFNQNEDQKGGMAGPHIRHLRSAGMRLLFASAPPTRGASRTPLGELLTCHFRALGSPVGGGAWSSVAGGPRSSVKRGFNASAHTWYALTVGCSFSAGFIIPSKSLPFRSASLSLMFRYRILLPSATRERLLLILSIMGSTAMLSFRGKMAVTMMVAPGALERMTSIAVCRPLAMSATLASSSSAGAPLPTLFVPARRTMIFGSTPSSSPLFSRQRMF